jgi:hypothetical protein
VAVGDDNAENGTGSSDHPFSLSWNGHAWHAAFVPIPRGESGVSFQAISCDARGICMAVGEASTPGAAGVPLAERLYRGRWTIQRIAAVPQIAADGGFLSSVSCTGTRDCTVVGTYGDVNQGWFIERYR